MLRLERKSRTLLFDLNRNGLLKARTDDIISPNDFSEILGL